MTVYVVVEGIFSEGNTIQDVFTSRTKAEEYCQKATGLLVPDDDEDYTIKKDYSWLSIEPWIVK